MHLITIEHCRLVRCCSKQGRNDHRAVTQEGVRTVPWLQVWQKSHLTALQATSCTSFYARVKMCWPLPFFVDVIIRCKTYFVLFISVVHTNHENMFTCTTKISGTTVSHVAVFKSFKMSIVPTQSVMATKGIYVMRKVQIGTILGLSHANLETKLCATILGLATQSMDCT